MSAAKLKESRQINEEIEPQMSGKLTIKEGVSSLHRKQYEFTLGRHRGDKHCLYYGKINSPEVSEGVILITSDSRIFQFGQREFCINDLRNNYTLVAESEEELRLWIDALSVISSSYSTLIPPDIHLWSRVQMNKPTWCAFCTEFIYGLTKQGFGCARCDIHVHPRCLRLVSTSNSHSCSGINISK